MRAKVYNLVFIIAGGFILNYCSPGIDIGDALVPIFHPTWPVTNCYTVVMNNYNTDPIEQAKMKVKYLNADDVEVIIDKYTNDNGVVCFDNFNIYYAEVSAEGFQTRIFDDNVPRTIVLEPI